MVRAVARRASVGLKWNVLRECTENVSTATRTADVANGRNNLGVRERRNLSQKVMAMKANGTTVKATVRSTGVSIFRQTTNMTKIERPTQSDALSWAVRTPPRVKFRGTPTVTRNAIQLRASNRRYLETYLLDGIPVGQLLAPDCCVLCRMFAGVRLPPASKLKGRRASAHPPDGSHRQSLV